MLVISSFAREVREKVRRKAEGVCVVTVTGDRCKLIDDLEERWTATEGILGK